MGFNSIIKNKVDEIYLGDVAVLVKGKFNCSDKEALNLVEEYRKWLVAKTLYPYLRLSPSTDIDEVWHLHLSDSARYANDCLTNFGEVIGHNSYLPTEENILRAKRQFDMTKKVWLKLFGYEINGIAAVCD